MISFKKLGRQTLIKIYNKVLYRFVPKIVKTNENFKMYINPKDRYISVPLLLHGIYEENITRLFKRIVKRGMVVVDIGANIGYYTLLASKLVGSYGKVIAIEPEPFNFNLLNKNVKLNKFEDRCILINKAISNFSGEAKLYISDENPGDHTLIQSNNRSKWIYIQTTTLDALLNELKINKVDVIKMDIQGYEIVALEGMTDTINKNKNIILIMEFWPKGIEQAGFTPHDLIEKIEGLGFIYYIIGNNGKLIYMNKDKLIEFAKEKGHVDLFLIKKNSNLKDEIVDKLIYTWSDVYSKPPSFLNFLADNVLHLHYLLEVLKLRPKKVLEVGCGTASHSIFLSFFLRRTKFYCLDNNEKVLETARKNAQKYRRKNIKFILGDAFRLSKIFKEKEFDVAISQGLLEHFSNEEIQKLIDEQLKVANVVIINVPSEYYPCEGILNERRISKEEWKKILEKYNEKYNVKIKNLIDVGVRTRMLALKRNFRFILKPMHYLIVIKDKG